MSETQNLAFIGQDVSENESNEPQRAKDEARRLFELVEGKHERDQQIRRQIHLGILIGFWVGFSLMIIFLIVWAWQLLLPARLFFVTITSFDIIQAIIVSIVGSSFLTKHVRNFFGKLND
ncbi:MAG: hypothetical protein OXF06_00030 [Bacteroidetes bacterium]|nr:hypothetical protein [Bacteroidota bacterium]